MSKFQKATKKITAIAATAVMASSAVLGAGLSNYPTNFVDNGSFNGKVVVGASAAASDSVAANSIISDLKAEFSGDSEKVKITYKSASAGGESRSVSRNNEELNYGETIASVTENGGFDKQDLAMLADDKFKNGNSDTDYSQTLQLRNGTFNHALRDNVEGVTKISDNVYYSANTVFATYTLTLDNSLTLSTSAAKTNGLSGDFVGKTLNIMGNEFTIAEITASSNNLSKLVLVGGANKISLGEAESQTVSVEGQSYEVMVSSVSSSKVLLSINGETKSIDLYDTVEVGGVNVAVTDLVSSSRDSVKGYAEIVVGGQKIELRDGGLVVKVNDEDVDKVYTNYYITSTLGNDFSTITIDYSVDDDTSLEMGDSLVDPLFGAFTVSYDGTNNPTYETIEVSSNDDSVRLKANLIGGDSFNRDLLQSTDMNNANGAVYLRGAQDEDRIFFSGSTTAAGFNTSTGYSNGNVKLTNSTGGYAGTLTNVTFSLTSTGIRGSGFLLYTDAEEQYMYEVASIDVNGADHEVDFDEVLQGKDETTIKRTGWDTDLGKSITTLEAAGSVNVALSQLGNTIAFANEGLLVLTSAAESSALGDGSTVDLYFSLDTADVDEDTTNDDNSVIKLTLGRDTTDNEWDVKTVTTSSGNGFTNSGSLADVADGNSDVNEYVNVFGTKVVYDNKDKTYVKIMIPNKQLAAKVTIMAGSEAASTMTTTVDAADVDAKKASLEDAGYTIVGTEAVSATAVSFDVSAPVMDSAVTGMEDMIVVGGPAVNKVAAALLGMSYPTMGAASGVNAGEAVVRFFEASNSVLVYGYDAADTTAAAAKLNEGGLSGSLVNVQ